MTETRATYSTFLTQVTTAAQEIRAGARARLQTPQAEEWQARLDECERFSAASDAEAHETIAELRQALLALVQGIERSTFKLGDGSRLLFPTDLELEIQDAREVLGREATL